MPLWRWALHFPNTLPSGQIPEGVTRTPSEGFPTSSPIFPKQKEQPLPLPLPVWLGRPSQHKGEPEGIQEILFSPDNAWLPP